MSKTIDLNDYEDAILHMMYAYLMESGDDTDASFMDFNDAETVKYLNLIQSRAVARKIARQYNWSRASFPADFRK